MLAENTSTYLVEARFDHIGDLKVRAPVALAGVTIGQVIEITVDATSYRASVLLRIDADFDNLPVDTDAAITTTGLLGGKCIDLTPGGDTGLRKIRVRLRLPSRQFYSTI